MCHQWKVQLKGIELLVLGLMLVLAFPSVSHSAELTLETAGGVDSNPFRLSDTFPVDSEVYWKNRLSFEVGESSPWEWRFSATDWRFPGDDRADATVTTTRLGRLIELGESDHTLNLSAGARINDRTFVSRSQGDVYTTGGQEAGERYNYDRWDISADFDFRFKNRRTLQLDFEYRDQDYDDFTDLGISNLDYRAIDLELTWQAYLNKQFRYRLILDVNHRDYDDRRSKTQAGTDIPGSDSEYDSLGFSVQGRYRLSDRSYLYTTIGYSEREDNGGGYYDTDALTASIRYRYRWPSDATLWVSAYYRDLDYARGALLQDVENDAEPPSTAGWRMVVTYDHPLKKYERGTLSWFTNARYHNYRSDRSIYEYDRWTWEVGLRFTR